MCLSVPNASPGTTATCAFASSRSENCSGVARCRLRPNAQPIFGIRVERALRLAAVHAGDLAQPLNHEIARACDTRPA